MPSRFKNSNPLDTHAGITGRFTTDDLRYFPDRQLHRYSFLSALFFCLAHWVLYCLITLSVRSIFEGM